MKMRVVLKSMYSPGKMEAANSCCGSKGLAADCCGSEVAGGNSCCVGKQKGSGW